MSIFTGSGVAIVTPMNADESVNYAKLEELIDFQISSGTDAIVICGTTGESSTLSEEEHSAVIRAAIEMVHHRVPVIAGTGSNSTATAVQLTQDAERDGADAALIVTPYYNKATQRGLIRHYGRIADATKLPIILYNVPGRTGCNILPETVAELVASKENIVGLKEATGNMAQATRTKQLCGDRLELYSGEDGLVLPLLSLGGLGVISVVANVAPRQMRDLVAAWFAGDIDRARELQFGMLDLVDALFCEVNPIPVKTALNLMGMEAGPLRAPLCDMAEGTKERLRRALEEYGLLG